MTSFIDKTAETIKSLRAERGLSQEELAGAVFVTRQAVSRWENGETMPSVDTLRELSKFFDVTINKLLGEPTRLICQCCGMPLDESSFSTAPDGGADPDYCRWCYTDGEFVYKSIPELVEYLVNHVPLGNLSREQSEEVFTKSLMELDHWKDK